MECTPAFHNLFPHSSPLHVYKQRPEEGGRVLGVGGGGVEGREGGQECRVLSFDEADIIQASPGTSISSVIIYMEHFCI